MEALISTAIGGIVVLLTSIIGIYGAKKLGIGENQEKLVSTLKGLVDAQALEINQLKDQIRTYERKQKDLEAKVDRLTDLTVAQAQEILSLKVNKGA